MTFSSHPVFACRLDASRLARIALVIALAVPAAACSTLESLNPFGGEKYEAKILPDEPADQIYDQGLARLYNGDGEGAAKKFSDPTSNILFRLIRAVAS